MPRAASPVPGLAGRFAIAIPDRAGDAPRFRAHGFRAILTPQHVAELDLRPPADRRLATQHGKWRNRLRHAERAGLQVDHRPFDAAKDLQLLDLDAAQQRHKGYRALPRAFTLAWAAANPEDTRLFLARSCGGMISFMLMLLHAPTASYHIGWTGSAGRAASAHHLLLWSAAAWLADHGYGRLDLGPIDTESAPGLARFKIGSGALVRPLGPTMLRLARPWRG